MKRVKCIILIAILTLAMAACNTSAVTTSEDISSGSENTEVISLEEDSENSQENSVEEEKEESVQASEEDVKEEQDSSKEDASDSENDSEGTENSEAEEAPEEEEKPEEPEFVVEEYNAVLFVKKAVNVRKGPSTDYEKIGGLNKGDQIQVTGIADTGWYQIQFNDAIADVASSYLMDEASYQAMIAEEEAAALAAQQQAAAEQAAAEQAAAEQAAAEQAAQQRAAAEQAAAEQAAAEQAALQQQQQQVAQGDYKAQVVAIMNQERANAGVGGISQNASLDAVAQIRAQEIAQSFSHTRPNGTSCFTVLDEGGIAYMTAGENIAAGYGDPASVMSGWMNSPGHRANILNGSFGQVGIGYYTDPNSGYGTYWVQIFTN